MVCIITCLVVFMCEICFVVFSINPTQHPPLRRLNTDGILSVARNFIVFLNVFGILISCPKMYGVYLVGLSGILLESSEECLEEIEYEWPKGSAPCWIATSDKSLVNIRSQAYIKGSKCHNSLCYI